MGNSKAFNYSFSLERKKKERKAELKTKTVPNATSSESCSLSWQWRTLHFLFMGKHFGSLPLDHSSEREPQGRFRDIFFITFKLHLSIAITLKFQLYALMLASIFSHFTLHLCLWGSDGQTSVPQSLNLLSGAELCV